MPGSSWNCAASHWAYLYKKTTRKENTAGTLCFSGAWVFVGVAFDFEVVVSCVLRCFLQLLRYA